MAFLDPVAGAIVRAGSSHSGPPRPSRDGHAACQTTAQFAADTLFVPLCESLDGLAVILQTGTMSASPLQAPCTKGPTAAKRLFLSSNSRQWGLGEPAQDKKNPPLPPPSSLAPYSTVHRF